MKKKHPYPIFIIIILLGTLLAGLTYVGMIETDKDQMNNLGDFSTTTIFQKNNSQLFLLSPVQALFVSKNALIIGNDSLAFINDTLKTRIIYKPEKPEIWRNYFSGLLGESTSSDNLNRWDSALLKFKATFFKEWQRLSVQDSLRQKLSDEDQLTYILVSTIKNHPETAYFIEGKTIEKIDKSKLSFVDDIDLKKVNQQNKQYKHLLYGYFLISMALVILGITGLLQSKDIYKSLPVFKNTIERNELTQPEGDIKKVAEPAKKDTPGTDLTRIYMENFQKTYGDFYTNLELMTGFPSDEKAIQKAKQQLIEMGLHAHSFARAYLYNYLGRPNKEPNLILIFEQKIVKDLDAGLYRNLSLDGQKTNKRYRYLAQILAEMKISSLEGALLNNTYVSQDTLAQLR